MSKEPNKSFLHVLLENYEAAKKLSNLDCKRSSKELLIETYEDLIAIYEKNFWRPIDKPSDLAESILRKHWHISFQDEMNQDAIKETLSAMQEFADQEKEKVAVAFAEWTHTEGYSYPTICNEWERYDKKTDKWIHFSSSDLYQYFITNVYNK